MDPEKRRKISEAARILELPDRASIEEIKKQYRKMVMKWHPDRKPGEGKGQSAKNYDEMIEKINGAYEIIMEYIREYRYPLSEEAIIDEETYLMKRFGEDPIWG